MALVIATLVLQAAAGVVGLGFSIHPLLVLVLMTSIALAITSKKRPVPAAHLS
jgi:hypothetical protein